jgi:hypothetical protein
MEPALIITIVTVVIVVIVVGFSLLLTLAVTAAAIGIPIWLIRKNQKKAEELMATGKQGEATILELQDTGMLINNQPRVNMLLEVRIPGYSPYQIWKTVTIPLIRLSQVQVGAVVGVMADPEQPTNPDKVGLLLR